MKSLIEYIKESRDQASIKFNFDGMDNADEILKKFESIQSASVNNKEVKVMNNANVDELKKVYDILKEYSDGERNGSHRTNDEQYAQKTIEFEKKVNELKKMIDNIEAPDDNKAEDLKADDKKSDDKKDDKKDDEKEEKKEEE